MTWREPSLPTTVLMVSLGHDCIWLVTNQGDTMEIIAAILSILASMLVIYTECNKTKE